MWHSNKNFVKLLKYLKTNNFCTKSCSYNKWRDYIWRSKTKVCQGKSRHWVAGTFLTAFPSQSSTARDISLLSLSLWLRVIILAKLEFKFFREIFNKRTRNHFVWFVSENPDKTWSISKVLIIVHLKAILPRAAVWLEISGVIPHLVCFCKSAKTTRQDQGVSGISWHWGVSPLWPASDLIFTCQ